MEIKETAHPDHETIRIIREVNTGMIQRNYLQVKQDVENLVNAEVKRIMDDPTLVSLIVIKKA